MHLLKSKGFICNNSDSDFIVQWEIKLEKWYKNIAKIKCHKNTIKIKQVNQVPQYFKRNLDFLKNLGCNTLSFRGIRLQQHGHCFVN